MVSPGALKKIALSFPEATEEPHFEKISFRVKKKIFATYDGVNGRACIKLSLVDQSVFSTYDRNVIYPVDNKWGKQGWTNIELKKIPRALLVDAITTAYCGVAPKSLAAMVKRSGQNDV